ncbi:splicing factor 3B subunit 10-domain-containing protein [Lentinula boryana]|uniref:Splicing factor 3B subunit 10-domain-containing protein n=1 Tax=Lentinula boryana TaxID=40481 RepID=A0ABQ8QUW3_9AGAR|nr:splicing factor 3B subunit 10-domain-containing protein [Lentinula boryana]
MSSELRYTANTQLEHLHARYTGTGHADLTKNYSRIFGFACNHLSSSAIAEVLTVKTLRSEWLTHQHRDTLSSIVGHPTLTSFLAIADGVSIARVKYDMTQKMLQPCGPPPKKDDD